VKALKNILYKVSIESVIGSTDRSITALHYDSRRVESGTIFVAIKGGVYDGHAFISKAIELGATVIVCQELPEKIVDTITYIKVDDSQKSLAIMASNYH